MRTALLIAGCLMVVMGLVWIGQGTGYFPYPASSFMIDQSPWVLRGAVLVVAGVAVLIWRRSRST